jgi:Copper amine oxidase, enzyme domain
MSRDWRNLLFRILCAAGACILTGAAAAQPVCNGTTEHLMSWPASDPVWEFCWLRPQDSTPAPRGSGLEIRDVFYNGHKVLERGHAPILNVEYEPGGCGCYRDWSDQERVFQADNVISPGYAEPTSPPVTVCENGGVDIGSFAGVAAEKLADRLILTTQIEAGWYRYTMKWQFFLDGRIEPFFGFAAVCNPCVSCSHRHHVYWRLDFDIDGPANDVVTEGPNPGSGGRGEPSYPTVNLPTEAMRRANRPAITWSIADAGTHRGYRIIPGAETELPADTFSVGDLWALQYKSNELDDGGPTCSAQLNNFVNGEGLAADAVIWYRGGSQHIGDQVLCDSPSSDCEDGCETVGPTLRPFGDWSPAGGGH